MTCPECGSIRILRGNAWTCTNCGTNALAGACVKCKTAPAETMWVGEGGVLEMTHGLYEMRCKRCCVVDQLAHARRAAAQVPALEAEPKALTPPHWLDQEEATRAGRRDGSVPPGRGAG